MSKDNTPMKFKLIRDVDASGISGIGHVADGVVFWNGKCVLCWRTADSSIAIYDNIDVLKRIHGHQGKTKVVWIYN